MKILKSQLKQIIKEEHNKLLSEGSEYKREKIRSGEYGSMKFDPGPTTIPRKLKTVEAVQKAFMDIVNKERLDIDNPVYEDFRKNEQYGTFAKSSPSVRYLNKQSVTKEEIEQQLEYLSNLVRKFDPSFQTPKINPAFDPMKGVEQK